MEDLNAIFVELRTLLKQYQPPLVPKLDDDAHYDLWSVKDLVIAGRERKEVFFAGLIIQKAYVGFYYMPVYANPDMKEVFAPELLKLLKGKSCFHLKKLDGALKRQIEHALAAGIECYRENGWIA
jgi:hypothetical protein